MAIGVRRISLTHEMLYFLHSSVREVIYALIDILGHFQSFFNHEILVKLNFLIFFLLVGQQEKSQKYSDLLVFN